MELDLHLVAAAALNLCATFNKYLEVQQRHTVIKKQIRKRKCWMQSIHQERSRVSLNNRLAELLTEPTGQYFIHMSSTDFEYLLQKISPIIQKQDTHWRDSIPAKIRLAVTLRFLATGETYSTLHRYFKISSSIVSRIIPEVCRALNLVLKNMIRMPTSPEGWVTKTKGFQFPRCLGALDGRHISIWAPSHTGPEDLNYQGGFSMVLLSLVDSDYCFMHAGIMQSQNTDFEVLRDSNLWLKMCDNTLNLPENERTQDMPYVFISDGTFPLNNHIMKPFLGHHPTGTPEAIYNQLLLQSHAVIDNAFGIISAVFKVLLKPVTLEPTKCSAVIRSCLLLHNFLIKSESSRDIYCPPGSVDVYVDGELISQGSWRHQNQDHFFPLQTLPCTSEAESVRIRLNFLDYIYRDSLRN